MIKVQKDWECKHSEYLDYIEAGFRVIRLHPIINGVCACDDGEACEMAGKHPFSAGWQNTPHWDKEQIETQMEFGWLDQYGILIDKHLVVDIDPRNGGDESFKKLCKDLKLDLMAESGHYVKTGGGGYHIFFKTPDGHPLLTKLQQYPGIDFKTSGFVVGAGSMHKSGKVYEIVEGYPQDAEDAPVGLLSLLKRESTYHRVLLNNEPVTVDEAELSAMLEHIPSDDYNDWISVGMGIHHATNGVGVDLWDEWSKKSDKYDDYNQIQKRWHSFGKSQNPITIATIYKLAENNGYIQPVTFEAGSAIKRVMDAEPDGSTHQEKAHSEANGKRTNPIPPINFKAIDRLMPPGFVGEVAKYIKAQNLRPRDWLSVMGALSLVGNIGGLRYKDDISGVTSNMFFMGVAGSGTSKNSVIESCLEMYRRVGIADAVNGRIKSEQELIRNLMEHQANFYMIDEFGKFLGKISKSGSGSAHYLDGITGVLMDAYSKADGYFMLSGDQRRQYKNELAREFKAVESKLEANNDLSDSEKLVAELRSASLKTMLKDSENGVKKPFVSITALTTTLGFNDFFTQETVQDGFLGRCLLFKEVDDAPGMNELKNRQEWDNNLVNKFFSIYNGTSYTNEAGGRIEFNGERQRIMTTDEGRKLMMRVSNYFNDLAKYFAESNGFEALALRGYEAVSKVSLILAIADKVRTVEHIEYAFAVVKHDITDKINLVTQTETKDSKSNDDLVEHFTKRVASCLSNGGIGESLVLRKLNSGKPKLTEHDGLRLLEELVKTKVIKRIVVGSKGVRYEWI